MANTTIQLKYSTLTATPSSLNVAEPAYSNTSGKLYVGGTNQTPILIGGKYYVDRVDEATSSNTANVIVKRDSEGAFSASYVRANLEIHITKAELQQVKSDLENELRMLQTNPNVKVSDEEIKSISRI